MAPTLDFPRNRTVLGPTQVSSMALPGALRSRSEAGVVRTRATVDAGRTWTETYDMLRFGDPTVENFLTFLERAWNRGLFFNIKHLTTKGSGLAPNGTGSGGVTVNGGGQTGDTINTTGWPLSTSDVVVAGDLLRIGGIGYVVKAYENANSDGSGNASIKINPPIFTGNAPSGGASVTTTDVDIYATLAKNPQVPNSSNALYYSGLQLSFVEAPNA